MRDPHYHPDPWWAFWGGFIDYLEGVLDRLEEHLSHLPGSGTRGHP